MKTLKQGKGFTLIELLTVITIIAILAAIIFPVFATVKRRARTTACASNLRQAGMGIAQYAQDASERYPYALDPSDKQASQIWDDFFVRNPNLLPPGVSNVSSWLKSLPMMHEVTQPYIKNQEIWRCPNDTGVQWMDFNDQYINGEPTLYEAFKTSYFFRTEIAFRRLRIMSFDDNARINVLFDGSGAWHTGGQKARRQFEVLGYVSGYSYNVLYGDLHVKNASFNEVQAAWDTPLVAGADPR